MMQQYNVTGMSCAACSARVEKAVSKVALSFSELRSSPLQATSSEASIAKELRRCSRLSYIIEKSLIICIPQRIQTVSKTAIMQ